MRPNSIDEYLKFALALAKQAGQIIHDSTDAVLDITVKADRSPVTQIDKRINKLVIESIQRAYPDHGVLGEEADYGTGTEKWQWLIIEEAGGKVTGLDRSSLIFNRKVDHVVASNGVDHNLLLKIANAVVPNQLGK